MPLLRKEQYFHPETLFEMSTISTASTKTWWGVFTKPRQEKSLARTLLAKQVDFFLPTVKREHLSRSRKRVSYVPLFTSYMFIRCTESERVMALESNRITQLMGVPDVELLFHQLCQIQTLIQADAPMTVEKMIEPGQLVRVKDGPFAGMEGFVTNRRNGARLFVDITMLDSSVSVDIEDYMLEPLS